MRNDRSAIYFNLVQDVANQKAKIQKSDDAMTAGGEGDQEKRAIDKPEDLLKLIMTTDELPKTSPAPSEEPGEV